MEEMKALQLMGLKHKDFTINVTTSSVECNGEDYGIDRTYLYITEHIKDEEYNFDNLVCSWDIVDIKEKEIEEIEALGFDLSKIATKECKICKQRINLENTKSLEGWREIQISGICESCFDKMFQ